MPQCMGLLNTAVVCDKTAEPSEMPVGDGLRWVQGTMYSVVAQGDGAILDGISQPIVKYSE